MNEKYIIASNGCENIVEDGKVIGYEFQIRIPYYQGVPLSQVKFIKAKIDGVEAPQEQMTLFTITGEELKLSEIITVSYYYWEYGQKMRVRVYQDGGLPKGKHKLEVEAAIDVIYAPTGFGTYAYKEFEI